MVSAPLPQPLNYDEKLAEFDSIPLFMRSLPGDSAGDAALEALQALVHEGTPDELAKSFKQQGNDYFIGRRFAEARGFYTQGLDAKSTDPVLNEALLCNRAACNLELQNYGMTLRDCSAAILLNPKSSKAYYRSALALTSLERFEEAVDVCQRCLQFDERNEGVRSALQRATMLRAAKDKKEQDRQAQIKREAEQKDILRAGLLARNLVVKANQASDTNQYGFPQFDDTASKPYTPETHLMFPTFLLYPEHNTSDYIPHFIEDTDFTSQLNAMFPTDNRPPDWDPQRRYTAKSVSVYAITTRKRLLKIGGKMTLRQVFETAGKTKDQQKDGLDVTDGCLSFTVLLKGEVEQKWIDDFKKNRDGG